jgi:hypothetical protein
VRRRQGHRRSRGQESGHYPERGASPIPEVQHGPARFAARLPIEYFDTIFIDECHRSIYNLWRQVVEYFDAYLTGLTVASPFGCVRRRGQRAHPGT